MSARLSYQYHKHAKAALKGVQDVFVEKNGPRAFPVSAFAQFCFDTLEGETGYLTPDFSARLDGLVAAAERLRPDKARWLAQAEIILHLSERLLGIAAPTGQKAGYDSIEVHRLRRKDCGTYSTPNHIVDNIVRRTLLALDAEKTRNRGTINVVDLSAEAGHFALATLGLADRRNVHFHAFDRDPEAVDLNRTLLDNAGRLAGPAGFRFRSSLRESVMCRPDELLTMEVDAVIGNPPWKILHPTDAKALVNSYSPMLRARFDVYLAFILRADQLLRKGGVLGMVLPSAFLYNDSASGVRKYLLDRYDPIYLGTYPRQAFIEYRGVAPVAVLLRKKAPPAERAATQIDVHHSLSEVVPPAASYEIDGGAAWRNNPRAAFTPGPSVHSLARSRAGTRRVSLTEIGSFSSGAKFSPRRACAPQLSFVGIGAKNVSPFQVNSTNAISFTDSCTVFDRSPPVQFLPVPKVFFQTVRCVSLAQRLVAAVGGSGELACSSAAMFVPSDAAHADFTAGLLNSTFVNAWYKSRDQNHSIKISVLKELEIPLDEPLWLEIAQRSRQLAAAHGARSDRGRNLGMVSEADHIDLLGLRRELDELVFDLYAIGAVERARLNSLSVMRSF
ncbi:Eco57I restriction-modification methylase domain-containing protein [Sinorhizobium medicae]|uniref:Eco57I restriction-modification methylase domain-containing protein n=1 Tax=Sinorhizobium TaxID=28105 RepID=UPI0011ADA681|nr:N-6 DNA methylase [Sinorhizobium medicae]TWA50542.1 N-6 DNA methylase [Sinorhizobium medicae]